MWATPLCEIGSRISHTDNHKHGAYILDDANAPGFAQPELHRLSLRVLAAASPLTTSLCSIGMLAPPIMVSSGLRIIGEFLHWRGVGTPQV